MARTHTLAEIRQAYPDLPANTETGQIVGVAGRVMFARNSGKLCFATLQEGDGTQLQAMVSLDRVGQESLDAWKADVDLGDIVYHARRGDQFPARGTICACRFLANYFQGVAPASRRP